MATKMIQGKALLAAGLAALTLAGCASTQSGDVYSRHETRREMYIRTGVVESMRPVRLQGARSGVGSSAGAVIGGIAGSGLARDGAGMVIGAVIGAVAGGILGNAVEENTTQSTAMEYIIRLSSGQVVAVVQEGGLDGSIRPGDRVRLMSGSGGGTRVVRDTGGRDGGSYRY